MMLAFSLLGIIASVVICHLRVRLFQFWKYARIIDKIPGLKCLPIFGNALDLFVPYEDLANTVFTILRKEQEAGRSIVRLASKYVDKSNEYHFAKNMLGDGILFSKRELWEKRRKMINPSFNVSVLKEFIPIFNDQIEICLQKFKIVDDGRIFDVVPYFRNLALDIICETIIGVKINAQEDNANEFVKAHHEIGDIFTQRTTNPFLYPAFIYNLTSYKRRELQYCKVIRTFGLKVIQERVQYLKHQKHQQNIKNGEEKADEKQIYGKKRHLTTLDLLIEGTCDGQKLTDHDLLDEVAIQIAAGHETTSDSIAFAVFLLGCNPEAQAIAQKEVDSILGECDHPVTSDDLQSLKYLDAVIKETYRLYPPIPLFCRQMDEDVVIDGNTIPAGTSVYMMNFVIHRDANVFSDPDKFDPERFLGAKNNGPSMYEYMPFSQGPRNCIGSKLGIWETKMAVAKILQKYDVISHDKPEALKLAISPDLRSYHGLKISLRRRKQF